MNDIPSTFWMIIITVLTTVLVLLLFYLALSARELFKALKKVNTYVDVMELTILSVRETVNDTIVKWKSFTETLEEFNNIIRKPILFIKKMISKIFNI